MGYRIPGTEKFDTSQLKALSASIDGMNLEDLRELFHEIMEEGIHGLCFSIYEEGQSPGDIISKEQVANRIKIIQPHASWVRSFSCIEGNEWVPVVAKEQGMKTLVGAWLGTSSDLNRKEIDGLINMAKDGLVDVAAVGNEVLYRNDLSKQELLNFMDEVKQAVPEVQVGYVDAYYEFTRHPDLTNACDVVLSNCYPFWEGCPMEYSLSHMQQMYAQAKSVDPNKKVIISETGWPSKGEPFQASFPSELNALKYFVQTQLWVKAEEIESFYFASFDEDWKTGDEGDVGAFWGLWDKAGKLKY